MEQYWIFSVIIFVVNMRYINRVYVKDKTNQSYIKLQIVIDIADMIK